MRSIISFIIPFFMVVQLQAQIVPQVPTGKPGEVEKPTPKIKLQADLTAWCYDLTTRKTATETFITVSVAVKNNGLATSNIATVRGLIGLNPANAATVATPPVHYSDDTKSLGSWKFCTGAVVMEAIAPGATLRKTFEYKIATSELGHMKKIFFCALADYFNTTTESNENNNMSGPLGFLNPNY